MAAENEKQPENHEVLGQKLKMADKVIAAMKGITINDALEILEFTKPILADMKENAKVTASHSNSDSKNGQDEDMRPIIYNEEPYDPQVQYVIPAEEKRNSDLLTRFLVEVGLAVVIALTVSEIKKGIKKDLTAMASTNTQRMLIIGGFGLAFAGLGIAFVYLVRKGKFNGVVKSIAAPIQRSELNQLHPAVRSKFERFIDRVEKETGYIVYVTSTYRSFAKQQELHRQDSRNAPAGGSYHNYGMAMDFNLIKNDERLRKSSAKAKWSATGVPEIARQMGFRWGGDFSSYYDPIHIDTGKEYSMDTLKKAAASQYGNDASKVQGNRITIT